ncbi:sigma 54-interacting transcriptional regulator [uncultured Nitrospira sp.]|uniref:sigma 54-interacting transcriptional regulator n=1 Tax=uncultured Nitrospira sp. TaxID=157176 RepID=UPI00313FEEDF
MDKLAQSVLGDQSSRYQSLLEVSEAIAAHRNLTNLIQDLAQRLPRIVPLNFIGLALHRPEQNTIQDYIIQANIPADIQGGKEWALDAHPSGWVWQAQQPLIISDLTQDSRFPTVLPLMLEDGVQSLCTVPLTTALRRLGSLDFASVEKDTYKESELTFLLQVARQVAVAVDNVLHQEELSRERDRLQVLLDVNNAVVSKLELGALFTTMVAAMRRVVPHEVTSLYLYNPGAKNFHRHVLDFPSGKGLLGGRHSIALDDTPAGEAFRSRKTVCWQKADLQQFHSDTAGQLIEEGVKSGCCVPLMLPDLVLGTLNVGSTRPSAFSGADADLLTQVGGQMAIALDNALAYQEITELKEKLEKENLYLREEIRTEANFEDIVGESRGLKHVLQQLEIVAPTDSTVLVLGETGTGKELIARALHQLSTRNDRAFVKINCAAIPTGLLESELFGHEKGAFTGAISQKVGRFELAHRGTIFLDEIGEVPLELQSKMLRVLQEQEFERLGGTRTIRVDVRLVAATNRDLMQMVEAAEFRSDLYYRLNVFPITVPPLRERQEDIPILVRYFAQRYATRMKKPIETIPSKTMERLAGYPWPGNIRELENLIERAVILSQGSELAVPLLDLKADLQRGTQSMATLEGAERDHILRALQDTKWVIGGAAGTAARLGMKRTTLISKMKKLGISRPT